MYKNTCQRCHRDFLSSHKNQIHCSNACRKARHIKTCLTCNSTFVTYRDGKYCSKKCSRKDPIERFWQKVVIGKQDECWIWQCGSGRDNRGAFFDGHRCVAPYRYSWAITYGSIPEGMLICHHCDNGKCVNPSHLFLGTAKDNTHDMIRKGRKVLLLGENDPKSKLKESDVREIRSLYTPRGKYSQYKLAKMYGVSRGCIEAIIRRDSWNHI